MLYRLTRSLPINRGYHGRIDLYHTARPTPRFRHHHYLHEHFESLRLQARENYEVMSRLYLDARKTEDRDEARKQRKSAREHCARMHELNRVASDWVFKRSNEGLPPGQIDLHGLFVKEAMARVATRLCTAKRLRPMSILHVIAGGHQINGGKIREALLAALKTLEIRANPDYGNGGVILVDVSTVDPARVEEWAAKEYSGDTPRKYDAWKLREHDPYHYSRSLWAVKCSRSTRDFAMRCETLFDAESMCVVGP